MVRMKEERSERKVLRDSCLGEGVCCCERRRILEKDLCDNFWIS
jgi:hypothetical protein